MALSFATVFVLMLMGAQTSALEGGSVPTISPTELVRDHHGLMRARAQCPHSGCTSAIQPSTAVDDGLRLAESSDHDHLMHNGVALLIRSQTQKHIKTRVIETPQTHIILAFVGPAALLAACVLGCIWKVQQGYEKEPPDAYLRKEDPFSDEVISWEAYKEKFAERFSAEEIEEMWYKLPRALDGSDQQPTKADVAKQDGVVKTIYAEAVAGGMPKNEAATYAIAEAKKRAKRATESTGRWTLKKQVSTE
jgi:hypothetical protein